jgi:hypothetical protein
MADTYFNTCPTLVGVNHSPTLATSLPFLISSALLLLTKLWMEYGHFGDGESANHLKIVL